MTNAKLATDPVADHEIRRSERWDRRGFVKGLGAMAGSAALLGFDPRLAAAEPPPETTDLRLGLNPVTCDAPQYVAEELLHAEGFANVRFIKWPADTQHWPPADLLSGEVDITVAFIPTDIINIDAGAPVVILAGSHIGCVQVVASDHVKSTRDLKGKTVAINTDTQNFIAMFAAYVGLNPQKDINWVPRRAEDWIRLLSEGSIDAFMSGPPITLEVREKRMGHALVNTTTDKPWSNYLCCLVTSTKEFVRKHPVATKRALRAIMKATDLCALEPKRVARLVADKGLAPYDYTLQTLQEIPYGMWRELDPNDSLRFYALRMYELGMIKSSPQRIITEGTDWRFLNELKRELKA